MRRENKMRRLTFEEIQKKKDFKKKKRHFMKNGTSGEKTTYQVFEPNEEYGSEEWNRIMKKFLELAIKEGRLVDPRVKDFPLDSLYLVRELPDGKWMLDSTEVYDKTVKKYNCRFCGKAITSEDILRPSQQHCQKCYDQRYLKTCLVCGKEFYGNTQNVKFCKGCIFQAKKLRSLRSKLSSRYKNEVAKILEKVRNGELKTEDIPTCKICGAILTSTNWYKHAMQRNERICRLCSLSRAALGRKIRRGK